MPSDWIMVWRLSASARFVWLTRVTGVIVEMGGQAAVTAEVGAASAW